MINHRQPLGAHLKCTSCKKECEERKLTASMGEAVSHGEEQLLQLLCSPRSLQSRQLHPQISRTRSSTQFCTCFMDHNRTDWPRTKGISSAALHLHCSLTHTRISIILPEFMEIFLCWIQSKCLSLNKSRDNKVLKELKRKFQGGQLTLTHCFTVSSVQSALQTVDTSVKLKQTSFYKWTNSHKHKHTWTLEYTDTTVAGIINVLVVLMHPSWTVMIMCYETKHFIRKTDHELALVSSSFKKKHVVAVFLNSPNIKCTVLSTGTTKKFRLALFI